MTASKVLEALVGWCFAIVILSLGTSWALPALGQSAPGAAGRGKPAANLADQQAIPNKGLRPVAATKPPTPAIKERWALVIGNAKYAEQPLANPGNDAQDMRDALAAMGWNADLVINGDATQMRSAIAAFLGRLRAGDQALFYYSGHGVQINGENYLLPVGIRFDSQAEVTQHAIAANAVLRGMSDRGPGVNVLILDACRDNPLPAVTRSSRRGLAEMDAQRGAPNSLIAYATAPGLTAEDGEGRNGTYTAALLRQMRRDVFVMDALQDVRSDVRTTTAGKQTPWESSSLEDRFRFTADEEPVRVEYTQEGEYLVSVRNTNQSIKVRTSGAPSEVRHIALRLYADNPTEWAEQLKRSLADLDDAIRWKGQLDMATKRVPDRPECAADRERLLKAGQTANDRRARFETRSAADAAKEALQSPVMEACEGKQWPWRTITWISSASVAVATAIAGTAYATRASHKWDDALKVCPNKTCPGDQVDATAAEQLYRNARHPANLATVFYTLATVSAGGGLAAYLLWPGDEQVPPLEQAWSVPSIDWVITPDLAQLNARMRF